MELIVTSARPSLDAWAAAQVARHLFPQALALPVASPEPILERARALLGSQTSEVLVDTAIPVLVIR